MSPIVPLHLIILNSCSFLLLRTATLPVKYNTVFGIKSDVNIDFCPPATCPFLGATSGMRTLDNPHAFTVHGVRSTKGEGPSSRSSRHNNTVNCGVPTVNTISGMNREAGQRLFGAAMQRADKM